jgi:cellulose synthase/poly-beta-1,6-N-acetylglucosamine synthase-like glycosyltransferase
VYQYQIGMTASYIALTLGAFYFIYAFKYYASSLVALGAFSIDPTRLKDGHPIQRILAPRHSEHVPIGDEPWVSIHLPFFNELNVARRILEACMDINYTNFEVLVADDSRDTTVEILRERGWRHDNPVIKFVHRKDRSGYKGGALQQAMKFIHPLTEYVVVFDADFVPPTNILRQFIHQFRLHEPDAKPVAAVQGYQLHYLNRNENWITKGVRAEFSGSYMIERFAEELFGAMKMVSGSVFMFKASVLKELGWNHSITEDWDLTLRLYLEGYKVVYTPLIQAPAEIPTTVKRVIRQRMRWAEGHTYAVKKYFLSVIRSSKLTVAEKLEFLYFAPYYLQSFVFIIGSIAWIVAQYYKRHPAFWTPTFGWSLVFSNLLAIPLMGLTGIFLEGDLAEDYNGVFAFIALSYFIMPYQAYAALKGLIEGKEGYWFRTLKTGHITDYFIDLKLRGLIEWINRLRKTRDIEFTEPVTPIRVPVRRLLFFALAFLMVWPVLEFCSGVSTGRSLVYYLVYVLRGVVNG